jgi:RNA polymerase sigma factor (sigma-70 family)
LDAQEKLARFEQLVLPHLDAAHNLARWLVRHDHDAQDVVQETYLRAFRFFEGFRGGDPRAWLLRIVRNTCFDWLRKNQPFEAAAEFDEELHSSERESPSPEALALQMADAQRLQHALEELPQAFREVLVLREIEGLSYKEIAEVAGIPIGTVMSSLSRARLRLRRALTQVPAKES